LHLPEQPVGRALVPRRRRRRHRLPPLTLYHRPLPPPGLRPVVAMAQKTEKKGKEQEVFLGVKGNAQASRRRRPSLCSAAHTFDQPSRRPALCWLPSLLDTAAGIIVLTCRSHARLCVMLCPLRLLCSCWA